MSPPQFLDDGSGTQDTQSRMVTSSELLLIQDDSLGITFHLAGERHRDGAALSSRTAGKVDEAAANQVLVGVEPSFEPPLGLRSLQRLAFPVADPTAATCPLLRSSSNSIDSAQRLHESGVHLKVSKHSLGAAKSNAASAANEVFITVGDCRDPLEADALSALAVACLRCSTSVNTQAILDAILTACDFRGASTPKHMPLFVSMFAVPVSVGFSPMNGSGSATSRSRQESIDRSGGVVSGAVRKMGQAVSTIANLLETSLKECGLKVPEGAEQRLDSLTFVTVWSLRGLVSGTPAFFTALSHSERMVVAAGVYGLGPAGPSRWSQGLQDALASASGAMFYLDIPMGTAKGGVGSLTLMHIDHGLCLAFHTSKSLGLSTTAVAGYIADSIKTNTSVNGKVNAASSRFARALSGTGSGAGPKKSGGGLCSAASDDVAQEPLSLPEQLQTLLPTIADAVAEERTAVAAILPDLGVLNWTVGTRFGRPDTATGGPIRLGGPGRATAASGSGDNSGVDVGSIRAAFLLQGTPAMGTEPELEAAQQGLLFDCLNMLQMKRKVRALAMKAVGAPTSPPSSSGSEVASRPGVKVSAQPTTDVVVSSFRDIKALDRGTNESAVHRYSLAEPWMGVVAKSAPASTSDGTTPSTVQWTNFCLLRSTPAGGDGTQLLLDEMLSSMKEAFTSAPTPAKSKSSNSSAAQWVMYKGPIEELMSLVSDE